MKNRRRSAKVPSFSKKGRRKQGRFEQNWGEMSPALLKIAKRRQKAKDREIREAKWRRKVCSKQDGKCSGEDSSVDRISMLPDEVLGLILSHFSVKQQMSFSILSRRWRYLWTLTTRLDFDGLTVDSLERLSQEKWISLEKVKLNYVSWVNRVLASHQGSTIEDFRVHFNMSNNDRRCIDEWLRYALAKQVKTLELNFTHYWARKKDGKCYVFPYRFLHIDEGIHFKQLKKISLHYVRVDEKALKFFLHNCPLLEDLSVSKSSQLSTLSVVGPFSSLKRLEVISCCNLDLLEIRDVNLVYLGCGGSDIELRLQNLPMLANLSVSNRVFQHTRVTVVQFSSIIRQLEVLYLNTISRKFYFPVKMSNLKQLEVTHWISNNESLLWLANLIRSVPHLQKFVLKAWHFLPEFSQRKLERTKILEKSYRKLKEVELVGFCGMASELEFVLHFVDNAAALNRIIIDARVRTDPWGCTIDDEYRQVEIVAMDRAEKLLAQQVPCKIKLDFLLPLDYPPSSVIF